MYTAKKRLENVFFAIVALAVLAFPIFELICVVRKEEVGSANAASWMQAVATILAFYVAGAAVLFQVEKARQSALEMEARTLKRKFSALCAILDDAYEQCLRLRGAYKDTDTAFGLLSFILIFDERAFEDAIANIEKIPLYELESYKAVRSISRLRNRLIAIKRHTLNAMDQDRDMEEAPDHAIKQHVQGLMSDAEIDYKNAVAALGGEPLKMVPPFSY